jgi:hypothetical protein
MAQRRGPGDEVLRARLTAQLLSGPPAPSALAATRHLLAVQGQDGRGLRLAMRVRSLTRHASEIDRALTHDRSLIVTWVNRGTLHLIAAEDEPLLHLLTTPQLQTGVAYALRREQVDAATAERGVSLICDALGADGPMTRAQLRERLERAGIRVAGQAIVHLLFKATIDGHIVRGPVLDGEHAFVLAEDWLGPRPTLDRDTALAELTRRYLIGHGPASERDLAKWAQLPLRDVRRGLAAVARDLTQGADGLIDLARRSAPEPLPLPRLLGPFDPLLLGWATRGFIIPEAGHVVTTNGIFKAVVLVDGQAAGTWIAPGGRPDLTLWHAPSRRVARALQQEADAVQRYLGAPEPG